MSRVEVEENWVNGVKEKPSVSVCSVKRPGVTAIEGRKEREALRKQRAFRWGEGQIIGNGGHTVRSSVRWKKAFKKNTV